MKSKTPRKKVTGFFKRGGGACTPHDVLENICIGHRIKIVAYKTMGSFANVEELKDYKQHKLQNYNFLDPLLLHQKEKQTKKEMTPQQDFLKQGARCLQSGWGKWLLSKSRNVSCWHTYFLLPRQALKVEEREKVKILFLKMRTPESKTNKSLETVLQKNHYSEVTLLVTTGFLKSWQLENRWASTPRILPGNNIPPVGQGLLLNS